MAIAAEMVGLTREQMLQMFRSMAEIRAFEHRAYELYREGVMRGTTHAYVGQEAVAVGVCSALGRDDTITSTHRGHGHCIAKGGDMSMMMAELLGKDTGYSRGKGGSMHFYDAPLGNFGGDGIVGGHLPIAAGIGYGIRLRQTDQVCLCFFGDGAINEGAFHETLNVSALWDLPVVYIIENNRYGMGTSIDRASSVKDLYQRGSAYGITRRDVNGMDVIAVRTAIGEAIDRARKEKRPTLIEAETYRYRGHSMSDPGKYRTKEEVEDMMKSDPILLWGRRLTEQERVTQSELDALDKEVVAQMDDAVRFVEESPDPPVESMYEDVYVRSPYINMKAAEKDPAWKAAIKEDRLPPKLAPWQPPPPDELAEPEAKGVAPDPATAAETATAKVGS
jgi:pyruvate dehydrogenase E1 component alpha subunit